MSDPAAVQRREVPPQQWVASVEAARVEGFTFFDWLTAVDRTYDEAAPGFDVAVGGSQRAASSLVTVLVAGLIIAFEAGHGGWLILFVKNFRDFSPCVY